MKKLTTPFFKNCIVLIAVMLMAAITSCQKNKEIVNALKAPPLTNRPLNTGDGLIGYWPLAGNGNDLSGNGHTSTLTNVTPTTDHLGNANGAMLFDGTSSKITIDDAQDLHLYNTDFTITAWVRVDGYNSGLNSAILSKRGGSFPNVGGYMMGFSGTKNVKGTPTTTGGNPSYYNGGLKITPDFEEYQTFDIGSWHQYTVTYSLSNQSITEYFDGLGEDAYYGVTTNTDTSYPLTIGFDQASISNGAYFKGAMSDIRIYNRVLTVDEIGQLNGGPVYQDQNTFNFTMTQSASPYIDGNLQIKVNGNVIDSEYSNNSGTLNIPWVDVLTPPWGTPFSVEAFTEDASSAANPMLTLTVTQGGLAPAITLFSQTIPAVPGASLVYNGMLYDYGWTYYITVTAN